MPRKYAVLTQFAQDLNRLLGEAEDSFRAMSQEKQPTQVQILTLFRPLHSLKGICGMVEEAKPLVRAFHLLEDALPPLLPVRLVKASPARDFVEIGELTFQMAREVERILRAKIELWRKLGADANDSTGLVVAFYETDVRVQVWIPITALSGLVTGAELESHASIVSCQIGASSPTAEVASAEKEYLLIESVSGPIALQFDEILASGTRLDALHQGVPHSFKEWWQGVQKSRISNAA